MVVRFQMKFLAFLFIFIDLRNTELNLSKDNHKDLSKLNLKKLKRKLVEDSYFK